MSPLSLTEYTVLWYWRLTLDKGSFLDKSNEVMLGFFQKRKSLLRHIHFTPKFCHKLPSNDFQWVMSQNILLIKTTCAFIDENYSTHLFSIMCKFPFPKELKLNIQNKNTKKPLFHCDSSHLKSHKLETEARGWQWVLGDKEHESSYRVCVLCFRIFKQ